MSAGSTSSSASKPIWEKLSAEINREFHRGRSARACYWHWNDRCKGVHPLALRPVERPAISDPNASLAGPPQRQPPPGHGLGSTPKSDAAAEPTFEELESADGDGDSMRENSDNGVQPPNDDCVIVEDADDAVAPSRRLLEWPSCADLPVGAVYKSSASLFRA